MPSLAGKIVLITGASRGLGRALALAFARKGAKLWLTARTEKDVLNAANEAKQVGSPEAVPFPADVRNKWDCRKLIESAVQHFGRIDVLINNAGVAIYNSLEEMHEKDLDEMIATNLKGTIFCCEHAFKFMKSQGRGHIINIASIAGKQGFPGESGYAATKFGVVGFSQALAAEAKPHNIKVTSFCQGGMDTSFWDNVADKPDVSTFLDPAEVADLVVAIAATSPNCVVNEITVRPMKDRNA